MGSSSSPGEGGPSHHGRPNVIVWYLSLFPTLTTSSGVKHTLEPRKQGNPHPSSSITAIIGLSPPLSVNWGGSENMLTHTYSLCHVRFQLALAALPEGTSKIGAAKGFKRV